MGTVIVCIIIIAALFLAVVVLAAVLIAMTCRYCETLRSLPFTREEHLPHGKPGKGQFPEDQA